MWTRTTTEELEVKSLWLKVADMLKEIKTEDYMDVALLDDKMVAEFYRVGGFYTMFYTNNYSPNEKCILSNNPRDDIHWAWGE